MVLSFHFRMMFSFQTTYKLHMFNFKLHIYIYILVWPSALKCTVSVSQCSAKRSREIQSSFLDCLLDRFFDLFSLVPTKRNKDSNSNGNNSNSIHNSNRNSKSKSAVTTATSATTMVKMQQHATTMQQS